MAFSTIVDWLYRKPASYLGFQKRYNWPLFFIFGGALFFFCIARLEYFSPQRYAAGALPGEWYWQHAGRYRVGLYIHLGAILPAGMLLVWQFVPAIRHRALIFHRINGYLVITLIFVSHAGALIINRRSFGGDIGVQAGVALSALMTSVSIILAMYNIKKLQIDQHRAWMLRTVFYMGYIITFRLLMVIGALVITSIGSYHGLFRCGEIAFLNKDDSGYLAAHYPQCVGMSEDTPVIVMASLGGGTGPENAGASLRINASMGGWLALFLHAVGVEIYLRLTPRESKRLRQVSATRQMEAGYKNPGNAGLTVERCGDAYPWIPRDSQQIEAKPKTASGDASSDAD